MKLDGNVFYEQVSQQSGKDREREANSTPSRRQCRWETAATTSTKTAPAMLVMKEKREFCAVVAVEERVHHTMLLNYYEHRKDLAHWSTLKEHPSLD